MTPVVKQEFNEPLPAWIVVQAPIDGTVAPALEDRYGLDPGEASAIALALETPDCEVILDEKLGRRVAGKLNLVVIGTVGIGILAKQAGLLPALRPFTDALLAAGLRLHPDILADALRQVDEGPRPA
ncbi:MAG: DUF3368 domain-containing protein [Hymenobacteraceae bacterium]|nr:DUF3368 domain-containing protein [Hymenobacteraceae bacterium]